MIQSPRERCMTPKAYGSVQRYVSYAYVSYDTEALKQQSKLSRVILVSKENEHWKFEVRTNARVQRWIPPASAQELTADQASLAAVPRTRTRPDLGGPCMEHAFTLWVTGSLRRCRHSYWCVGRCRRAICNNCAC